MKPFEWSFRFAGSRDCVDDRSCRSCAAVAHKKCSLHANLEPGCSECQAAAHLACPTHCGLARALEVHDLASTDSEQFGMARADKVPGDVGTRMVRSRLPDSPVLIERREAALASFAPAAQSILAQAALLPERAEVDVTARGDTRNGLVSVTIEFIGRP